MEDIKKDTIVYRNEFVDRFLFNYKQKALDVFFGILLKVQQDSSIIEFDKDELKKLIKTGNLSNKEFGELIKYIASQSIRYKTDENIIDEDSGRIIANVGDYVTKNFFDVLIEKEKENKVIIKIRREFKKYFFDLKTELGFSRHELKEVLVLDSRYNKLMFILLNRWKNYDKALIIDYDFFKEFLKIPNSYRNHDIKRILDKAKKDLHKHTNIRFDYKFNKKGNKVVNITFLMLKNKLKDIEDNDNSTYLEKKIAKIAMDKLNNND